MASITRTVTYSRGEHGRTDLDHTITTTYRAWGELLLLVAILAWCVLIFCASREPVLVQQRGVPAAASPDDQLDAQTFAALAVYELATDDDWLQRAAIARTTLNAFPAGGDSRQFRDRRVAAGTFDPIRWQNALDAVEAVTTGDYPLPVACTRATAVVPSTATAVPGPQCVVGGLAFVEQPL